MKIKLKKGVILDPVNNHYGLKLGEFFRLNAGCEVEVENVSDELSELIEKPKEKTDGNRQ